LSDLFRLSLVIVYCFIYFYGESAPSGPGPPNFRGFMITPRSVRLLWTSDQSDAETSAWQHATLREIDIHASGGIRNRNRSERPKTHYLNDSAAGISAVNLCIK